MKLDGASMPHGAIPLIGSSFGASKTKYRDKIYADENYLTTSITTTAAATKTAIVRRPLKNSNGISTNENLLLNQRNKQTCCWLQKFFDDKLLKKTTTTTTTTRTSGRVEGNLKISGKTTEMVNCKKCHNCCHRKYSDNETKAISGEFNGINSCKRSQQSFITKFLFNFSSDLNLFNSKMKFNNSILLILLSLILFSLPNYVKCDENDFFARGFSIEPDTTPEFDYASRGSKKFGDKCDNTLECGFPGSICDPKRKLCQCTDDLPVTNHLDKCGKVVSHNKSCFFNEQCESFYYQTECRDGRCICRFELHAAMKDGKFECIAGPGKTNDERYIDPAMIGVLVAMAIMFIIICIVLRLFAQARWRENRTIFNTPNPRLMNVSLLRESKLLHGQERRGSRVSMRGPSRQPSMASLRPHSPNPSLGKRGSRPGSRSSNSNGSAYSVRSRSESVPHINNHHPRKNSITSAGLHEQNLIQHQLHQHPNQHHQPLITNVTSNPVADNVTVEIIEPSSKTHTDI